MKSFRRRVQVSKYLDSYINTFIHSMDSTCWYKDHRWNEGCCFPCMYLICGVHSQGSWAAVCQYLAYEAMLGYGGGTGQVAPPTHCLHVISQYLNCVMCVHLFIMSCFLLIAFGFFAFWMISNFSVMHSSQYLWPGLYVVHFFMTDHLISGSLIAFVVLSIFICLSRWKQRVR